MKRLHLLTISLVTLFAIEFVRVGLFGLKPMFSSGFECAMSAFAMAWVADEIVVAQADKTADGGKIKELEGKIVSAVFKPIYIDLPDLGSVVALGETTIQRMFREGQFPTPR